MLEETNYLNTYQAGQWLGLSEKTLIRYRVRGEGPAFYRFGTRIRYRREDLDDWAELHRSASAGDDGTAPAGAER